MGGCMYHIRDGIHGGCMYHIRDGIHGGVYVPY